MTLKDKYISKSDKDKEPSSTKSEISDDAYAICMFMEMLANEIGRQQ